MDFISENYVWFIVGGIVILMAVIGYIADKTDFGRNKVAKKTKEEIKPEKIEIDNKGINEFAQNLAENTQPEEINAIPEQEIDAFADFTSPIINNEEPVETTEAEVPTYDVPSFDGVLPADNLENTTSEPVEYTVPTEVVEEPVETTEAAEEPVQLEDTTVPTEIVEEPVETTEAVEEPVTVAQDEIITEPTVPVENLTEPVVSEDLYAPLEPQTEEVATDEPVVLNENTNVESEDDIWKF